MACASVLYNSGLWKKNLQSESNINLKLIFSRETYQKYDQETNFFVPETSLDYFERPFGKILLE